MKKLIYLFTFILFISSCSEQAEKEVVTSISTNNDVLANAETQFNIDGMTCAHGCAAVIEKEISKMEGVKSSEVNFETKVATIAYDNKTVSKEDFINKVKSIGDDQYKATEINNDTEVTGDEEGEEEGNDLSQVLSFDFELPNILDFFTNII
jgi:Cu+-exporting ATPase